MTALLSQQTPQPAQSPDRRRPGPPHAGPAQERRLTYRLMTYWQTRAGQRDWPALNDIEPAAIADLWPHCFVIRRFGNNSFPYFHYLGSALRTYSGIYLSGRFDWTQTLLDKAVRDFRRVFDEGAPLLHEDSLTRFDGGRLLFRSVLLPLSDDGRSVDFVLGAANGMTLAPDGGDSDGDGDGLDVASAVQDERGQVRGDPGMIADAAADCLVRDEQAQMRQLRDLAVSVARLFRRP
ncbi:MAG: PAS domain-containing protein [Alphaproteobacteria bacterium]